MGLSYSTVKGHLEPDPSVQDWLQQLPLAWAETGGMRLASHHPLSLWRSNQGVEAVKVYQYPMPL